jgi:hypothetical protein
MSDNERFENVRQEIMHLLHAQLEALANLSGLTDAQLAACYKRQERVRELRDQLTLTEHGAVPEQASAPFAADQTAAAVS